MHQRGITVTFSGVDGAGKSTIIEEVRQTLQKKYRQKIVVLRHRPSLLPILSSVVHGKSEAEKRTREKLPRQGTNKSVVSSLFRFTYYYLDYLVGQYYIYFRYTLRGYTVLYDRYYFDFIIDSRRSNIVLPKGFMKWCYHFIFKPQVNVFLFASPEIIRSRKQELSQEDITSLTTTISCNQ
jgi:thymidylate kinase